MHQCSEKIFRRSGSLLFDPLLIFLFALSISSIFVVIYSTYQLEFYQSYPDTIIDHDHDNNIDRVSVADVVQNKIINIQNTQNIRKENTPSLKQKISTSVPILPAFASLEKDVADRLIENTIHYNNPSIAGILSLLQNFQRDLHISNQNLHDQVEKITDFQTFSKLIIRRTLNLITEKLVDQFDAQYRGESIFPIREEEDSIFLSLASYREHLLTETLIGAYKHAKNPDKLYAGVIVQNCFGAVSIKEEEGENMKFASLTIDTEGLPCKTGVQVVGEDERGRPITKVSDAPPDVNGIEGFCKDPFYKKYCEAGQIRVLYVSETEALGPAMARYYASKLWGGETFFVQTDSHLQFAKHWDEKYVNEIKATKNYPKSILSSYPPGFQDEGNTNTRISEGIVQETNGARLCQCEFSTNFIEKQIIRINATGRYQTSAPRPTQIPFMAAGFFFAHARFLVDVPFDPYLPWCFMGEEIALSVRAWTSGWNMYAPRKNYILHHYRPGRLGLPKYWEIVNRLYGRHVGNNQLQGKVIERVRNLLGYPESSREIIEQSGYEMVLKDQEYYGLGNERTMEEYMSWVGIDVQNKKCSKISWCINNELE